MPEPQNTGGEVAETDVRASTPDSESPTRTAASSQDGTPPDRPADDAEPSKSTPPRNDPNPATEAVTSSDAADSEHSGESAGDEINDTSAEQSATASKRVAGSLEEPDEDDAEAETARLSTVDDEKPSEEPETARLKTAAGSEEQPSPEPETARLKTVDREEPDSDSQVQASDDDEAGVQQTARLKTAAADASSQAAEDGAVQETMPITAGGAAKEAASSTKRVAGSLGEEPASDAAAQTDDEAEADEDPAAEPGAKPEPAAEEGAVGAESGAAEPGDEAEPVFPSTDAEAEADSAPDEPAAEAEPAESEKPAGDEPAAEPDEAADAGEAAESGAESAGEPEAESGEAESGEAESGEAESESAGEAEPEVGTTGTEAAAEAEGGTTDAEEESGTAAESGSPADGSEEAGTPAESGAPVKGEAEAESSDSEPDAESADTEAATATTADSAPEQADTKTESSSATESEEAAQDTESADAAEAEAAADTATDAAEAGTDDAETTATAEAEADAGTATTPEAETGAAEPASPGEDSAEPESERSAGTEEKARVVEPPVAPVEQTQQFSPITDATPPPSGTPAAPPPSGVEQTQQISRVEAAGLAGQPQVHETQQIPRIDAPEQSAPIESTQQIARIPAETESEKTTRIDLKDLEALRAADPGPATQQIKAVPPVAPAEQTQQFARPDFDGPPPRAASAADFAGLTAPHAKPTGRSLPPPGPTASPDDFAGLTPPRAQPQRIEPQSATPADFAGLAAPQPAAPEDFAGLTGSRAQPQRIPPPGPPPMPPVRAEPPKAEPPRRRKTLIAVAVAVVVLLGAGIAFGPQLVDALMKTQIAEPPAPVRLDPSIKPLDRNAQLPQQSGIRSVLAGPLSDTQSLGTLGGVVLDAQTGSVLWQQNQGQALMPASTGKLLTTSAALLALDHQHRFTTKVVRGSTPGSVVLVGGGDPTLSKLPAGEESVYDGAPRLDDLAAQVMAATGGNVTSVQVDTSRYTGPEVARGWLPQDVAAGFYSPMQSAMLDGGRADPARDTSPRSQTPAMETAQELATRLGLGLAYVSEGTAPPNAQVLGQVQSATVQDMVETTLQRSDNMLAEALTREVAIATGNEPSFAGGTKAVFDVLRQNGFDVGGSTMADGSGLSLEDRVTPKLLAELLASATAPASPEGGLPPQAAKLRALLPGLPIAGGSGSLASRYQDGVGQGWVRAKTGTLDGANSLAGTVVTKDGRLLVFALVSNGTSSAAARPALDKLAGALSTCGC
ncbi:D-alanyl-D-alanine carboxypeptidase/D-alanyl-D-alanine-endopeptidase [Saccharopolyspora sp. NPDC050642]|uniref:D-alanyl-D-alanine carboxypeptidase/D-alanyl-D-alanine endopeptidase n=1 Tax=Saccharopolyspora sp. NPDC050642 TaxID=3157099 RepID=UPI0033DA9183